MKIAIVGGGPSGCALAILLAREGAGVTLFDDGRRPELLVGESLIPAVIPIFQRLGIEQEVASFSRVKPGASFVWSTSDRFSFSFARFAPAVPPYAYNIPRPRFDEALVAAALAAGVRRVNTRARLVRAANPDGGELSLASETLEAAPELGGRQPDLIVDATGRSRLAARVLGIGAHTGPRTDVAHFAHFEGWSWDDAPGQVVIRRLEAGWAWCIPLQERLSIGIVVPRPYADRLGATPVERLERTIADDPWLRTIGGTSKRVTPVATYSNYQLISERGHGPGFVMIGDAFGFVDPMLSPGVFVALRSAEMVADAIIPMLRRDDLTPRAVSAAMVPYASTQTALLLAWMDLVAYFYDGRMSALFRAGRDFVNGGSGAWRNAAQDHIERHVALQAAGVGTLSGYSRGLLRLLGRHGLRGVDPVALAIR